MENKQLAKEIQERLTGLGYKICYIEDNSTHLRGDNGIRVTVHDKTLNEGFELRVDITTPLMRNLKTGLTCRVGDGDLLSSISDFLINIKDIINKQPQVEILDIKLNRLKEEFINKNDREPTHLICSQSIYTLIINLLQNKDIPCLNELSLVSANTKDDVLYFL